ncbi:MAG: AEC family transporter [Sphingobacteriaceae bacterium]|nr:MAG: AEC family transporter [Sphingobacteriaceae bacterium]
MLNLLLIFICFLAGIIVKQAGLTPGNAYKGINVWILNIAVPAIFLRNIPYIKWTTNLLLPLVAPVVIWIGSYIIFTFLAAKWKLSKATAGALILTAGLSNTSFLGFIGVYYHERDISIAAVYDQISFVLLATVGLITALRSSGSSLCTTKYMCYRLITFPPFVACGIALILPCFISFAPINPLLDKIASTIGPLALFSIGVQSNFSGLKKHAKTLLAGLCYKHFIAPGLILAFSAWLGQGGIIAQISVFQAAMPTLATASVLADETNLDAELANLMVGIGIILSFATTCIWWYILM